MTKHLIWLAFKLINSVDQRSPTIFNTQIGGKQRIKRKRVFLFFALLEDVNLLTRSERFKKFSYFKICLDL